MQKRDELSLTHAQKPWWPHTALRRGLLQDTGPGRPPTKAVCREGVGSSQNRREGDAEADDRPAEDTPRASSSRRTRGRDPGAGEKPSGCGAAQTRPRPGPGAAWGGGSAGAQGLGRAAVLGAPPGMWAGTAPRGQAARRPHSPDGHVALGCFVLIDLPRSRLEISLGASGTARRNPETRAPGPLCRTRGFSQVCYLKREDGVSTSGFGQSVAGAARQLPPMPGHCPPRRPQTAAALARWPMLTGPEPGPPGWRRVPSRG